MPTHTVVLVDHFDSFTYNIVDALEHLDVEVVCVSSLGIEEGAIQALNPTHLILGPGPGHPKDCPLYLIHAFKDKLPILGICLGHQAIACAFGGKVVRAKEPRHGKVESITHDGEGLFNHLPPSFSITRYHSLIVDNVTLPSSLSIQAMSSSGEIMALKHNHYPIRAVQFHPESIASECGDKILMNFFAL